MKSSSFWMGLLLLGLGIGYGFFYVLSGFATYMFVAKGLWGLVAGGLSIPFAIFFGVLFLGIDEQQ
jgi:hypothetical protein